MLIVTKVNSYKTAPHDFCVGYGAAVASFQVSEARAKGGYTHVQPTPVSQSLVDKVEKHSSMKGLGPEGPPPDALKACAYAEEELDLPRGGE